MVLRNWVNQLFSSFEFIHSIRKTSIISVRGNVCLLAKSSPLFSIFYFFLYIFCFIHVIFLGIILGTTFQLILGIPFDLVKRGPTFQAILHLCHRVTCLFGINAGYADSPTLCSVDLIFQLCSFQVHDQPNYIIC